MLTAESVSSKSAGDDSIEKEYLNAYIDELFEFTGKIRVKLEEMLKSPHDVEVINGTFRLFHNMKGSSSIMNSTIVQELAHNSESLLDTFRKEKLVFNQGFYNVLNEALDAIKEVAENLRKSGEEGTVRFFHVLAKLVDASQKGHVDANMLGVQAHHSHEKEGGGEYVGDGVIMPNSQFEQLVNVAKRSFVLHESLSTTDLQSIDMDEFKTGCSEVVTGLVKCVIRLKYTSIAPLFNFLKMTVQATAKATHKDVHFRAEGEYVLLDKHILKGLKDPLLHIIRNAIDHGIEQPDDRAKRRKDRFGRIMIRAFYKDGKVNIDIFDDGKGIDPEKIKNAAVHKGFIDQDKIRRMTAFEAQQLVFLPGFSSADKVSNISGRGVGMDVVMNSVKDLGGEIEVQSAVGFGTTVSIRIPDASIHLFKIFVKNKEKDSAA